MTLINGDYRSAPGFATKVKQTRDDKSFERVGGGGGAQKKQENATGVIKDHRQVEI